MPCNSTQLTDAKESDLLCYLTFIDILCQLFVNNTTPFLYQSGSNDTFRFELLNTLLTLLAYYNRQALSLRVEHEPEPLKRKELSRARARLFLLCGEVLKEIDVRCKATPHEEGRFIVYRAAPRSLSMDPVKGVIIVADGEEACDDSVDLQTFIESAFGSEKSRLARVELCMAKKHEAIYDVVICGQSLKQDTDGKLRMNLIGRIALIHHAYLKVVEYTKDSPLNEILYRHARFMAHYWLYKAHYTLALHDSIGLLSILVSDTESDEELDRAQEVLARLMFITKEAIAMEKHQDIVKRLDPLLEAQYSTMLKEVAFLTEKFDRELYVRRGIHEKDMTLELVIIPERQPEKNAFTEARTEAFQEYYQLNPSFSRCRALLRSLTARLKQPTHAKELLSRSTTKKQQSSRPTPTIATVIGPMDKPTKLLFLDQRQEWLELFIENFSETDHAFVFNADLYDKFKRELDEVKRGKEEVNSHQ